MSSTAGCLQSVPSIIGCALPYEPGATTFSKSSAKFNEPAYGRSTTSSENPLAKWRNLKSGRKPKSWYHGVRNVSESEFNNMLQTSRLPIAVMISADWCIPCHHLKKALNVAAAEYRGKVEFVELDFDRLSEKFKKEIDIKNMPLLLLFCFRKVLGRLEGYASDSKDPHAPENLKGRGKNVAQIRTLLNKKSTCNSSPFRDAPL